MREKNLKMIRSQGWSSKISPRDLNALPLSCFSLPRFVSCTNSADIKSLQADSLAEDDNSAPLQYEKLAIPPEDLSGQLQSNGELRLKKKPWISRIGRLCQSTAVLPNSRVKIKIKKAQSLDMEAADQDGKINASDSDKHSGIRNNTPVTPASSLKESISTMEFEKRESGREHRVVRSRPVDVDNACKQFRKCLIEMVAEDKNVRDLMDVEELLYCYQNLTCPVYRDLVSHFYAEICSDIFLPSASSSFDDEENLSGSSVF
uniref:OVATE domain-containing protein n=1 Tax=Picea sitchensis TaxID=3332 RepID=D5AE90_PICSI|nr:unknown [Picea sitchensis]